MSDPNDPNDPSDQPQEQPAAIIPFVIGDDAIIGGEDQEPSPAPLPADEPLPSDSLFPGTSEE